MPTKYPTKYPTEFRHRAIRLVNTRLQDHDAPSMTRAIKDTATKLGILANTLIRWCSNAALDTGKEITTGSEANAENQTTQTGKHRTTQG